MKRLIVGAIAASCILTGLPRQAPLQSARAALTITGMYGPNGVYVPAHCAYTNPTTPGQLHPSGAQPGVTTNPAAVLSALPGQLVPTGVVARGRQSRARLLLEQRHRTGGPAALSLRDRTRGPGALVSPGTAEQMNPAYNFSLPAVRRGTPRSRSRRRTATTSWSPLPNSKGSVGPAASAAGGFRSLRPRPRRESVSSPSPVAGSRGVLSGAPVEAQIPGVARTAPPPGTGGSAGSGGCGRGAGPSREGGQ